MERKATAATSIHAASQTNAAVGETSVQSTPATALAARFPALCRAASRRNALPLMSSG
jgi:hypothetical protein